MAIDQRTGKVDWSSTAGMRPVPEVDDTSVKLVELKDSAGNLVDALDEEVAKLGSLDLSDSMRKALDPLSGLADQISALFDIKKEMAAAKKVDEEENRARKEQAAAAKEVATQLKEEKTAREKAIEDQKKAADKKRKQDDDEEKERREKAAKRTQDQNSVLQSIPGVSTAASILEPIASIGQAAMLASGPLSAIALSAAAVPAAFLGITEAAKPFVAALSPASLMLFDQVMNDLNATVGVALLPIIEIATEVMREFGSALLPIMEALKPAVQAVMEGFRAVLMPLIHLASVIGNALAPVVSMLADVFKGFMEYLGAVIEGWAVVIAGIIEVISGIFGGVGDAVKDTMTQFVDAVRAVVKNLIVFTAALAKMFGFDRFVDGALNALETKKQDNTGLAAPKNARITSISEYGRSVATAALMAGAGGQQKKTEDWLQDIRTELEQIRNGDAGNAEMIASKIVQAAFDIINGIVTGLQNKAYDVADSVIETGASAIIPGGGALLRSARNWVQGGGRDAGSSAGSAASAMGG